MLRSFRQSEELRKFRKCFGLDEYDDKNLDVKEMIWIMNTRQCPYNIKMAKFSHFFFAQ